jgi:histone-lysine N-methyltransferase SETMAR
MTKAAIQELDWEILPHPPYSPDLAPSDHHLSCSLSNNLCGISFNNNAELQKWLDDFFTAKPVHFFKCAIENLPECWEAVVNNGGEYITDFFIICVKNKFGSAKNPRELMHQPNTLIKPV